MMICASTYQKIMNSYPIVPPENGGIIGGMNGVVNAYYHDNTEQDQSCAVYLPNIVVLNQKITSWSQSGIDFMGIIHSHPTTQIDLSSSDIDYITHIMANVPYNINYLYFPIAIPNNMLYSYIALRCDSGIQIKSDEIKIIQF